MTKEIKMHKIKYLYSTAIILSILLSVSACKGKDKTASVDEILKESLNEHLRITNEVFYERGKESGKGTTIKLAGPVKVVLDKSGKKAITDTSLEVRYVSENKSDNTPIRVVWEFKDGTWSADRVLPEDFGFIISFDQSSLDKIKKKH